jgi:hypothetical protein
LRNLTDLCVDRSSSSPVRADSSSDDDPHIGQVTPSHLISPVLRVRSRGLFVRDECEDRSDDDDSDSNIDIDQSPTKDALRRRLSRTPTKLPNLKPAVW